MRLGTSEMLLILAVVLLMFGGTKLPQLGEALGKGIRSFKRAVGDVEGPVQDLPEQLPALPVARPVASPGAQVHVEPERRG